MRSTSEPIAQPIAQSIIPPEAVAAMVYFMLCRVWWTWLMVTLKFPLLGSTVPFRIITTRQYVMVSVINLGFGVAFVFAGIRSRASHPSLRKGHYGGLALGFCVVLLLQVWAIRAHGPIPLP